MKKKSDKVISFRFNVGKPLSSVDLKIIREILMGDKYLDREKEKELMRIMDLYIEEKEDFEKYMKLQEMQEKQIT